MKEVRGLFTCFLILYSLHAHSQVVDDLLHFGGGALVGTAGSFMASGLSVESPWGRISCAVGASLVAGLLKEVVDEYRYNGWNNKELAFTVLGGLTAGVTIELWKSRKKKGKQAAFLFENPAVSPYLYPKTLQLSGITYTE